MVRVSLVLSTIEQAWTDLTLKTGLVGTYRLAVLDLFISDVVAQVALVLVAVLEHLEWTTSYTAIIKFQLLI